MNDFANNTIMGSDRRLNRRYIETPGQLKENKITIEKGKILKKKGKDTDITVESPEFQLLVKLFVPSKLLIHNNRVSQKDLSEHLPIIINNSFPALNFELHIFLSSIVTSYVASWYTLKLNTENFEFLESVYKTICEFVKDFARRILQVMDLARLLSLINRWAFILDSHIRQVQIQEGIPLYAKQDLANRRGIITSSDDLMLEAITARYLEKSHIVFRTYQKLEFDASHPSTNAKNVVEDEDFEGENNKVSAWLTYLRLVVKNVVTAAFEQANEPLDTPVSSAIGMNLISLVLADLVLDRVISKLSTPRFILQTVIGKIGLNLRASLTKKEINTQYSFLERVKSSMSAIHLGINAWWNFMNKSEDVPPSELPLVLYSPFLSLIDGITNISSRRPVLTSILEIWRSLITSSSFLTKKIEAIVGRYVVGQTSRANFFQDEAQASIVRMFRGIVFGNGEPGATPPIESESIEELTDLWFKILSEDISSTLPMGISLQSFRYKNESQEELRKCVEDFLRIFDSGNSEPKGLYSEESDLNKLLVIRLFDSVIQCLYPELVEKISITV